MTTGSRLSVKKRTAPLLAPVLAMGLMAGMLSGCMVPVGPVEVTRFHAEQRLGELGSGSISVLPAVGQDPASLETRSYLVAVARELQRIGYTTPPDGESRQIALVRVERSLYQPDRASSPVSVGVGAGTGSFGSGAGLSLGFDLSGRSSEKVVTDMHVMIKDRASNETLWEGRASFVAPAGSPQAETQLAAAKLAEALFQNFPGNNGETVQIQ